MNAALTLILQAREEPPDSEPPWVLMFGFFNMIVVLAMTFWSLPFRVAKINTYVILCRIFTLDIRFPLQQWYTVPCPGGLTPRFSNRVYQSVGLVVGNVATLG